jgi:ribonuclease E
LVAIDVNSGRSTRERNVEETALRTNLEAADEVARQLRLRDLAGLIVIDLIDMESKRHNAMVERRLKEALKDDRARIQVGHISHFGLLEMSRQRLRPSLEETTLIICPHCNGTGHVRGTESAALHVLRGVEEEAGKRRSAEIIVHVAMAIALYILNHKRERLNEIERRYGMRVIIAADDSMIAPRFRIERLRTLAPGEEPRFVTPDAPRSAAVPAPVTGVGLAVPPEPVDVDEDEDIADAEADEADANVAAGNGEDTEESREAERRRRRRRRRRGGRDEKPRLPDAGSAPEQTFEPVTVVEPVDAVPEPAAEPVSGSGGGDDEAARRRSRRGRRGRGREGDLPPLGVPGAEQPDLIPAYAGPTPADPFGSGHVFDIFDVMEQAELNAAQARPPAGRRGAGSRSRWQPPHWAVAAYPPMLVGETAATDRPDRGPPIETWALASRPFMLRRDRHAPRWNRSAAPPAATPPNGTVAPAAAEPAAPRARPVPIEAGPPPAPAISVTAPPAPEFVDTAPPAPEPASPAPEVVAAPPPEVVVVPPPPVAEGAPAELPWSAAPEASTVAEALETVAHERQQEPPPVPANDVVSGPVVQPIVIGSESAPPLERKRGWWRRR